MSRQKFMNLHANGSGESRVHYFSGRMPLMSCPAPSPTCDSGEMRRGRRTVSQQGPMTRRLSISASSIDWLAPKMALKVWPVRPTGRAGWLAGYLICGHGTQVFR